MDSYLKVNPMGQVPALEVTDDNSGETSVLTQSVAIMEYLEELYPAVNLLPKDVRGRAKVCCILLGLQKSCISKYHPSFLL